MNLNGWLNAWGAAWADFMVRALIDSSLLLVALLLVWLPLRRWMSAQLAHGLFLLVLLKLVVPIPAAWLSARFDRQFGDVPIRISAWLHPVKPSTAGATPAAAVPMLEVPTTGDLVATAFDEPVTQPRLVAAEEVGAEGLATPPRSIHEALSIEAALMLGWGTLTLLLLARLGGTLWATRRLIQEADPLLPECLPVDLEPLLRAAGLRGRVRWAVSARLQSPAVGGLVQPTVVIPPDLDDGLTPKQLSWVLLHELAHIRRRDLWVVLVQRITQAVFFFHPAVHVANWIIDQLREYACDDAALAACQASRRDCGEGFLTIVGRHVERSVPLAPTPTLGLFESKTLIRRRLFRILDPRRRVQGRLSLGASAGLLAIALVVLPASWGRDAAARLLMPGESRTSRTAVPAPRPLAGGTEEPTNYRPGEVLFRRTEESPSGQGGAARAAGVRSGVLALAYSPDGATLATAGEDAVVNLRDVATGRVRARLQGHRDTVACLAFAPDGRTLASGSYDRTLRLWDVATGRERAVLEGHSNWVVAVAFAPDGKVVASAGYDKSVRLWDSASGRVLGHLAGHTSSVRSLAFTPDGTQLASGGADRVAILWDLRTRSRRLSLKGHRGTIRALGFAPDGATLATAGEDAEVKLWEVAGGRVWATLAGHSDMVNGLAFSPEGRTLATGSLDATVKLWDLKSGRERATLQGHSDGVSSLAFAPGARQLATGSYDGSVRLWESAAPIFGPTTCHDGAGAMQAVAFAPDGRTVLASGQADVLLRWDARTGATLPAVKTGGAALAVAPGGRVYATGGRDGIVRLWDAVTDAPIAVLAGHKGEVAALAFAPNGAWLASGGHDRTVRLWDVSGRRLLRALPALPLPITCLRFAPDGRSLAATTGNDPADERAGEVRLWSVATGKELGTLRGHSRAVTSIAFAPDGATLASAGVDGRVVLWDVAARAERGALRYNDCRSVTFSPDGRLLATGHLGGDILLWDGRTGRQLAYLKGHRELVGAVDFAPDSRSLASAGYDGSVKLWSLDVRRLTARATLKGDRGCLWSVAYAPDGQTLAVADGHSDSPGTITLWDLASRQVRTTLGHERGVAAVAYAPDGGTIASAGWDGTVRIWDAADGAFRDAFAGPDRVTRLVFSPDGTMLAAAGKDKTVALWNVESGSEVARFAGFRTQVHGLAFSHDGRWLATGGGDVNDRAGSPGEVTVWDVVRQVSVARLAGHTRAVLALTFAPDDATLATSGLDATVRLWDPSTGEARLILGGLPCWAQALAFSPDGRLLATGGRGDGIVALHDTTTGAEVARLVGHCSMVRDLAFAPDGLGLATVAADRSIKLWDLSSSTR